MDESAPKAKHIALTTDIVSAYVANNSLPPNDLPGLIHSIHAALGQVYARAAAPVEIQKSAVSVRNSLKHDYIVCLEDGKSFKSLKRHLRTQYDMTPEAYREKWGLPADYPMVAPSYAKARSDLAKGIGLGQQRKAAAV